MGSYSIALSGLVAQSEALNIVSNNLANLNTTGYKDSSASFQELVTQAMNSSTPNGAGVSSVTADRNFSQGSPQLTGGAYDAAIEGSGFFVVQNSQGQQLYTRSGNFSVNSSGSLVDANGDLVLGWTGTNGTVTASGAPAAITIPPGATAAPSPSTQFSIDANLNAAATPTAATGTFSAPVQVVDSLGETHNLTVTFTNTGSNAWSYAITVPGSDLTGGTAGTPSSLATGTLAFSSSGQLTSPASGSSGSVAVKLTGLADGAADLSLNWNLYNSDNSPTLTQYAETSATSATNVDGTTAAQLTNVALADGGTLVATYSNGEKQTVGQIALANIPNPDSLIDAGQNNFVLGGTTGTPTIGAAGTGGLGQVKAGALEASNVDIASEFTRLMTYQQSYEANSRAITTIDQMQQDLMQMKP